jgi:MoaA/NifB/PqqE/SkfB family radical SAM enzyme
MPVKMTINITGNCDLKCKYCEKSEHKNTIELKFDALLNLLSFAAENKVSVFISGGEPFLYSRIWELLEKCAGRNQKIAVVTNGNRLNDLTNEQYDILNRTISIMSLSIDHPTEGKEDNLRGVNGSFARTLNYLKSEKREHPVGINTVISVDLGNILPMIDFVADHKVPVNFKPLIFESCFPDIQKVEWKEGIERQMSAAFDRVSDLKLLDIYAKQKGAVTNLPLIRLYIGEYYKNAGSGRLFYESLFNRFMCFVPLMDMTVSETGTINPCIFLNGKESIYRGDIYRSWLKTALEFREDWKKGQRYKVCQSCSSHFAENMRYNIFARPLANFKYLPWFLNYYLHRMMHQEGRA